MEKLNDRQFWAQLRNRIARRTGRQDAEDLLHSAFLKLERYKAEHVVHNTTAFLLRTAVNLAIDRNRHNAFVVSQPVETVGADFVDPAPLQDEANRARERLERVRQGLDRLPVRTRDIFLMHRLDGLKYREIAERMGISQSAVEKQIAKAALFLAEWTEGW